MASRCHFSVAGFFEKKKKFVWNDKGPVRGVGPSTASPWSFVLPSKSRCMWDVLPTRALWPVSCKCGRRAGHSVGRVWQRQGAGPRSVLGCGGPCLALQETWTQEQPLEHSPGFAPDSDSSVFFSQLCFPAHSPGETSGSLVCQAVIIGGSRARERS